MLKPMPSRVRNAAWRVVVSRVVRKFIGGSGPVPVSGCSRVMAPLLNCQRRLKTGPILVRR